MPVSTNALFDNLKSSQISLNKWTQALESIFKRLLSLLLLENEGILILDELLDYSRSLSIGIRKFNLVINWVFELILSPQSSSQKQTLILNKIFTLLNSPRLSDQKRASVFNELFKYMKSQHLSHVERSEIYNRVLSSKYRGTILINALYKFAARQVSCRGFPPTYVDYERCVHDALIIFPNQLVKNTINDKTFEYLCGIIRIKVICEIEERKKLKPLDDNKDQGQDTHSLKPKESDVTTCMPPDKPVPTPKINEEVVEKVIDAINKLPPTLRAYARMVIIQKLTRKQIIEATGISPALERQRWLRFRRVLRVMGFNV